MDLRPSQTHPTHRILLFLKTHGKSEGSRPRYIQQCLCPAAFCWVRLEALRVCHVYFFCGRCPPVRDAGPIIRRHRRSRLLEDGIDSMV